MPLCIIETLFYKENVITLELLDVFIMFMCDIIDKSYQLKNHTQIYWNNSSNIEYVEVVINMSWNLLNIKTV